MALQVSGGDGVDAALLATATNPDAGPQVTYNGWPLYYFSGDSAPGDTNGEGPGGVWYVVDPTGNPDRQRLTHRLHLAEIWRDKTLDPSPGRGLATGRVFESFFESFSSRLRS